MVAHIAIWLATAALLYSLVLSAHALRTRFGLAPLYILLGFSSAVMMWLFELGARMEIAGMTVFWGSTLFSTVLVGVFVLYVFDGSTAAKTAVGAVAGVVMLTFGLTKLFTLQASAGYTLLEMPLPEPAFLSYGASAGAALADLFFLAILWEVLRRQRWLRFNVVRIFLTLLATLWLDTAMFLSVAVGPPWEHGAVFGGSLADRAVLALFVSPILSGYLHWQQRLHGVDLGRDRVLAIFRRSADSERELSEAKRELALREEMEQAIRESEEKFRTLVENLPGITFRCLLDEHWTMLYLSDATEEVTGYPAANFIHNRVQTFDSIIHPEDKRRVMDRVLKSALTKEPYSVGYRIIRRDGVVRWLGERGKITFDSSGRPKWLDGVITDVTDRRLAEDRAIRYQFIANSVNDMMSFINRDWEYEAVNAAWCAAMGKAEDEVLGKTVAEVWGKKVFEEKVRPHLRACFDGQPQSYQDWQHYEGLGHRFCETLIYPYGDEAGEATHAVVVTCDITERKEQEDELARAKAAAEAANAAKSEFLATMSHEIRTPMNAIVGMAHLALKTELSPQQRDYLVKIQNASNALLNIINDILDFSKIEAGKLQVEDIPFRLEEVMEQCATLVTARAREKEHVEVLFQVAPEVPPMLTGDPLRIGQVITNLTSNAIKFTEAGEILVSVERLPADAGAALLRFSVRDTGIGMTEEQRTRLFTPFTQADSSTTRQYGGTGLGLTICKRLVELMDGEIGCESVAGEGSTFHFTVPFAVPQDVPVPLSPLDPELHGIKVLIVDDNENSREILLQMVSRVTARTAMCMNGEDGLRALHEADRAGDSFDLVLMDWKMPGLNGIDASKKALHEMGLKKPPAIILVTGFGREEVMRGASAAGLDAVLLKPVSQSTLFDTILGVFGKSLHRHGEPGAEQGAEAQARARLSGSHVLLAEDNLINQQIATELLSNAGIRVTTAGNGREALALLEEETFDGILMDIQMPELDGLEATRAIRGDGRFGGLPIIAMTANAMAEDRERCLAAGMNAHVGKPINPGDLFATLLEHLSAKHPDDGGEATTAAAPPAAGDGPTEEESPPLLPAELPGIDLEGAMQRLNGNAGLYRDLLEKFPPDFSEAVSELRDLAEGGDYEGAFHLAHNLKGVAGNIGADGVYAAAGVLEGRFRAPEEGLPAEAEWSQAAAALKEVVDGLRALGTARPHTRASETPGDPEVLVRRLEALVGLLRKRNPRQSRVLLEELQAAAWPEPVGRALEEMARHLGRYRFQECRELAEGMLRELGEGKMGDA